MKQYQVTGMSCAACSARVEKAVSKVPGVTACSVSLLTNSMGVEGTAGEQAVIAAVEAAGYGASVKGAPAAAVQAADDPLADHETPALKRRLYSSLVFLVALMYLSMGHMMWGWPAPALSCGKSCGDGACTAAVDGDHHGHQPAFFHQWLQESVAQKPQHGYAW